MDADHADGTPPGWVPKDLRNSESLWEQQHPHRSNSLSSAESARIRVIVVQAVKPAPLLRCRDEVIFRNYQGQRFTYKQPKQPGGGCGTDGAESPDIVPIEIAATQKRRGRRRKSANG